MIHNVLLLTIDALRHDALGCYGRAPSPTPNIDRLANRAIKFNQAISCGGWTRPSLTGLLSSTHPSMYGGSWGPFHAARPSLPERLQEVGVTTAAFISNPQIGSLYGFERGFEHFVEMEPTYAGPRWAYYPGVQKSLQHPLPHMILERFGVRSAPPAITATANELTEQLSLWLSSQTEPFFAWVHYMDTHWPYHISQELKGARELSQAWRDLRVMHRCVAHDSRLHPGEDALQQVIDAYDRAVRYVDDQIGWLAHTLEELGLRDSTAIILTSDHGEEFFEHGRWGHYQLYEENVRVPLLVWLPNSSAVTVEQEVSHLDLAPTILDLLGANKTQAMLGASLLRLLDDSEPVIRRDAIYTESMWPDNHRLAIRSGRFKYLYETNEPHEPQLYDLGADPAEQTNLWQQAGDKRKQFEALRRQLEELASETAAGLDMTDVTVNGQLQTRLRALGYMQ